MASSKLWSWRHSQLAARLPGGAVRQNNDLPCESRSDEADKDAPSPLVQEMQPRINELDMLLEYKLVAARRLPGVYVVPSSNSLLEWHGVMFVHSGLYQGGVFLFTLFIPDGYPQVRPMVKFRTKVHHPCVHQTNYVVNMSRVFPEWNPTQHHVCDVIAAVRHCFLHEGEWAGDHNPSFTKLARQCVQESISSPSLADPQSLIDLSPLNEELIEEARRLIHTGGLPRHQSSVNDSFLHNMSSHLERIIDSFIS